MSSMLLMDEQRMVTRQWVFTVCVEGVLMSGKTNRDEHGG